MHNLLLLLISSLFVFGTNAQDYNLIQKIQVEAQAVVVDKFEAIYIVETYKISKYSKKGELLFTYENLENGEISTFDVSNPLKPLVYYKDFNTLSILDNKLSELNSINLFEKNINQIELICSSNNMEFWIYDNIDNRLKKLDKQFNLVNQSESFFNLFDEFSFPKELKLSNNKLYLLDKNGISIFDLYGTLIKTISIKNLESFQTFDNSLVFVEEGKLTSYNEKTFQSKKMNLPYTKEEKLQVKLLKNKLITKTSKTIKIYSIN